MVELLLKREGIDLHAKAKTDHGLITRGDTQFRAACKGGTFRHREVAEALKAVGGDTAPPRRSSFELAAQAAGDLYSAIVGS